VESIDSGETGTRGVFITLEGPDGAGKSTQARSIAERVEALGRTVVLTREPGGTRLGERVRDVLMASDAEHDPLADALLFNAARRQLMAEVVEAALAASAVVICDRYADSTLAYQGYGGGAQLDVLRRVANAATAGLVPDRTVLLDLPIEVGLARRFGAAAADLTRFETGSGFDRAFHERVRAGFLELAALEPERWRLVDASGSAEDVAGEVWSAVADLFQAER
jgi:dTMP kinase